MLKIISGNNKENKNVIDANLERISNSIYAQRLIINYFPMAISKGIIDPEFYSRNVYNSVSSHYNLPDISEIINEFYIHDSNTFEIKEFPVVNLAISMGFGKINYSRFQNQRDISNSTKNFFTGITDSFKNPNDFIKVYNDFRELQINKYELLAGVFWIDSIHVLGNLLNDNTRFNLLRDVYDYFIKKEGFISAREYMLTLEEQLT